MSSGVFVFVYLRIRVLARMDQQIEHTTNQIDQRDQIDQSVVGFGCEMVSGAQSAFVLEWRFA